MKTTSISSLSISKAMQLTNSKSMTEVTKLQEEAVTGIYEDIGLELGTRTSTNLDYAREISRLQSMVDSNALAEERMSSSQLALNNMGTSAQSLLNSVTALSGNSDTTSLKVAADKAMATLENFVSYANSAVNGEYLFSGTKTDTQTLDDTFISDVTTDFNTAFSTFMTTNGITAVADVTAVQMNQFLTDYEASFNWASWTNASSTTMTTGISASESVSTSASANSDGFKSLVLATVVSSQLVNAGLNNNALAAVNTATTLYAGEAISGLNAERSRLGLSQERVEKANTYIGEQKSIINTQLTSLIGVDTEEASVRLTTLLTQIETSYKITSKILDMSLVNYL
ncbi:MAG TPA: flagellar hook-associated family protein [Rhizobium sp.]|nr:flagellar hook-associated family protein [Rhizobium sp.]